MGRKVNRLVYLLAAVLVLAGFIPQNRDAYGGLPAGAILLVDSGTCPAGTSEDTALDGQVLVATRASHGDVGTTGGSNSITPTVNALSLTAAAQPFAGSLGTVPAETISWPAGVPTFAGTPGTVPAQIFTGSSATTSAVSAGTPAGTNGASATSGNCAATNIAAGTGSTTACKATAPNLTVTAQVFTGSALATHTHTLTATGTNGTAAFTPAGTVAWPAGVPTNATVSFTPAGTNSSSAVSGSVTMNSFDPHPAFTRVIPCKSN